MAAAVSTSFIVFIGDLPRCWPGSSIHDDLHHRLRCFCPDARKVGPETGFRQMNSALRCSSVRSKSGLARRRLDQSGHKLSHQWSDDQNGRKSHKQEPSQAVNHLKKNRSINPTARAVAMPLTIQRHQTGKEQAKRTGREAMGQASHCHDLGSISASRQPQTAVNPLSTNRCAPLTKLASSLARNRAAFATSSGSHIRPCWAAMAASDASTP